MNRKEILAVPDPILFIVVLVSVAAFVVVVSMTLTRTLRVMLLAHRVKRYFRNIDTEQSVSIFKHGDAQSDLSVSRDWYGHLQNRIQEAYEQSGVTWSLPKLALGLFFLAILLVAAAIGSSTYWLLTLLPVICVVPFLVLKYYSRRKNLQIAIQLPAVFAAISRMVRSGQTIQSAMRVIAEDFPDPVRAEFLQCYEQQNLGVTKEHALKRLASRTGIIELRMFAVALIVQNRFGGDISELLQSLAEINRNRLALKQRMRALTAEGRMQALVLAVLPLGAFSAILFSNPDYITPLLDHPNVIIATVVLQAIGIVWILKIIKTDY